MTTQPAAPTPSAAFARRTLEETAVQLETSAVTGLTTLEANNRRARYGLNEFDVEDDEPIYLKFFKSFYENPLILLLLASAIVSLAMGQRDDAISITLAILIVVTGKASNRLVYCSDEANPYDDDNNNDNVITAATGVRFSPDRKEGLPPV
ncbi:High affinity Ca2+/Mn2+ P-type ATPase-like protein [Linnemannia elongata]|nr:High affinity Ca2+/Mn2+ P-type ATPase-like protein [Linnemannia elongata]